ncbi:MAG: TlpA family protein disulfide reductase [Prevotellaceae bacterium]|jgi:peroxiredoxin|nr:TlpA family protein disulfide reductase [Prevotellaceae bacterium]
MKKSIIISLCLLAAAGCSRPSATISGCIAGGEQAKITLMHQGATTQRLLDTLRADAGGCFRYVIKQAGKAFEPMFVSLAVDDRAVATLLVEGGEQVRITADRNRYPYTVEGSEGSSLLLLLNNDLYASSQRFDSLMALVTAAQQRQGNAGIPEALNMALGDVYVKQYRAAVTFLIRHPSSLACVAALNQSLPNGLPVFSRPDDAIRIKLVYDSLSVRYPRSEYVLALRDKYEERFNEMQLLSKMEIAPETGFIDIKIPNTKAEPVALSSLKGQVILVYFWTSTDKAQLMYNNELRELYEQYSPKGFTIYQVALDTDKALWAKAVTEQGLPWTNVCDGYGTASSVVRAYAVKSLPVGCLIDRDGDIVAAGLTNDAIAKKVAELCR